MSTRESDPSYIESLTPESVRLGAEGNVGGAREVERELTAAKAATAPQDFFSKLGRERSLKAASVESNALKADLGRITDLQKNNFDNSLKFERKLSNLNAAATTALVKETKQLQLDSMGRKIMNERQLQDWYSTKVASEEAWHGFEARVSQLHERKMQILKRSYEVMEAAENAAYAKYAGSIDQNTKRILAEKKQAIEAQMRQAETDAANSSALASGLGQVGGIVGGVVGGVMGAAGTYGFGAAAGAAGGSAAGSLAGSALGSHISKSQQKSRKNEEY